MAVPNTLAYYDTATITALKSFIVQAPGLIFTKPQNHSLTSYFWGKVPHCTSEEINFMLLGHIFLKNNHKTVTRCLVNFTPVWYSQDYLLTSYDQHVWVVGLHKTCKEVKLTLSL